MYHLEISRIIWISCSAPCVLWITLTELNYCLTLCCSLMAPWCNSSRKKTKKKLRWLPCHVGLFECVTERLCLPAVIWSLECAFSSTAPSSSSGSSRRMPGNTPAVRATALVSRPRHRPTWLFSVSVTVATKCRGRGGGRRYSSYVRRAAAVWRLLHCLAALL